MLGEAVECCTLDGESPVAESITSLRSDPSSMGHVESRVNQQGEIYQAYVKWEVNVGTTVQILVDIFNVRGIVHFGGAASVNESVVIGDVSVPDQVAYTAAWSWRNSSTDEVQPFLKDMVYGNLSFGDFNVPQKGDNLLGRIFYWASTWFTGQQTQNRGFWLPVNPDWLRIASQIQGLKLETHVNETVYVPYKPVVQFGLKAGTADLFIVNEAYGDFLHKTFNISTIDTSDSAITLTCFSNNIP
ncbi:bark storage protein A [Jatropha curcas]|uniref:bark storage protein A n=1 Tax=Jatropha curcas TaxID=180498 RepID=UPI00189441F7|nr:bark storage protein A [Jatropha curcas]